MICPRRIIFLIACLSSTLQALSQENGGSPNTIFNSIELTENPNVTLTFHLDSVIDDRNTMDYQLATFTLAEGDQQARVWNIEIRNRGRYRRRTCDFPPIKLKFENDSLVEAGMKKHNELKLVTHCLDDKEGEENLREEYLIYKLYEHLSPTHYRAKYVDIIYKDLGKNRKVKTQAIILEDESELAERFNSELCEDCYGRKVEEFDNFGLQVIVLYQYMVGNPDWSALLLRNVKLLKPEDGGKFLLAPYDFDFTGLVDATYARPDATLGISSVRERKVIGYFETQEELEEGIAFFKEKKADIIAFIESCSWMRKSEIKDAVKYIESFYEEIDRLNF